jgi:hypothetical protein
MSLEEIQNKSNAKRNEIDSFLKDMQDQKVFSVKEAIDDINDYLGKRKEVNDSINSHAEQVKTMINNFIMELSSREPDQKLLLELRKKLIEMEEIKIEEKLNFFRDTAELKRELRETLKEFREKESKNTILDEFFKK